MSYARVVCTRASSRNMTLSNAIRRSLVYTLDASSSENVAHCMGFHEKMHALLRWLHVHHLHLLTWSFFETCTMTNSVKRTSVSLGIACADPGSTREHLLNSTAILRACDPTCYACDLAWSACSCSVDPDVAFTSFLTRCALIMVLPAIAATAVVTAAVSWLALPRRVPTLFQTQQFDGKLLNTLIKPPSAGHASFAPGACSVIETHLQSEVVGQQLAIHQMSDAICDHLLKSHPEKPLVLSVHGPPGVGKSLSHRLLAQALYDVPGGDADCPGPHCQGYKVSLRRSAPHFC